MNKQIFIINGSGGVGKDTFVELVAEELDNLLSKYHTVANFSSVDRVKEIAKDIGWQGKKTEKDRKFLSDLKLLTSDYCDMPFESMKSKVKEFKNSDTYFLLFLHIREPNEIKRAAKEFNARTILVLRNSIKHITSNMADMNVYKYMYDCIIDNSGTIDDLRNKAKIFVKGCMEA